MSRTIKGMAVVGLALALCAPAAAQEQSETVIVTAVRNQPRSSLFTPAPVDAFSADALARTGAAGGELGEALATLAPSFNFPRQSNSGASDHIRAGQLRGLAPDQLLVLVNGKRRHSSAIVLSETKIGRGSAAVDFNTIPLGAVERIEVLRDGAGAQYGSDAIAGVVNVILKDDPEGGSISWTLGQHVTDFEPLDADIEDGETFAAEADWGVALGDQGFVRVGASVTDRDRTNRAGLDQGPFFIPATAANVATFGQRNYAEGDPETLSWTLWFNSEAAIGAATLYGFGSYYERETRGGATFFRYPDGADNVRALYPQGFRPESRGDNEDAALTGGVRFGAGGWNADASLTYGRNRFLYGVDRSLNASLGAASPTSFRSGAYELDQLTASLALDRGFDVDVLSGPLIVGAGVEYRRETYRTKAGEPASYAAGPEDGIIGAQGAPGLTPDDEVDIDRDVFAAYLDLSADVTERLFVNAATRYEDYEDFGGELTAKLSGLYRLTDALAVRGALSNSFRAPSLAQVGYSDTTLNFGVNRELVRTRTLRVNDPIAQTLGARALDPETSTNASIGLTAQLTPALSATIDAFRIDVDDRITLSERFAGPAFAQFVQALPGGADIGSVRFFTNAIDTKTTGVDVVAAYATEAFGGDLAIDAAYSYAQTEIERFAPTPAALTAIDPMLALVGVEEINTIEEAAPRNKTVLTTRWSNARVGAMARLSHYGATRRVFVFGASQRYGSEFRLDLEGSLRLSEIATLSIGADNLLDEYPDRSSDAINYFGNLPYDILSPVGVNGRFVYARVRATF